MKCCSPAAEQRSGSGWLSTREARERGTAADGPQQGFLATNKSSHAVPYRAAHPADAALVLFPDLYPAPREQELRAALGVAD